MSKPFLILQLRPEDEASDDELAAFKKFGGLEDSDIHRVRMEQGGVQAIELQGYSAIIIGGGPSNVSDSDDKKSPAQKIFEPQLHELLNNIIAVDFPLLGVCYGFGILARHLGGAVSKERYSEGVGAVTINLTDAAQNDPLLSGLPTNFRAFGGHKEACQDIPPNATVLASSGNCPLEFIKVKNNIYATQFHTELDQAGLALRINVYRHAGYFPPEDAEILIAASKHEEVTVPAEILSRFVKKYSS